MKIYDIWMFDDWSHSRDVRESLEKSFLLLDIRKIKENKTSKHYIL